MKRDWTSRTAILLVGIILVIVNLIGLNLFGRLDLTDDSVYSLSPASIDLVENLADPVTVTAFFTDDLPAPYSTNRRFLKDKLDDYRAYGGQNLQYRFVDPNSDEAMQEEATRFRIPPLQIQVIERDNVQLKNAYMGVAIQYGGERETIPVVQDLSTLEYDITSAIRRLTNDELPTVGFLSGHGEPDPFTDMQTLVQGLQQNYRVQPVTVADGALEPSPDALLVVAPVDSIPDAELRAIDEYLMNGGRLAVLINRVQANLQMGQAGPLEVGLTPLLTAYGANVKQDLVMDEESSTLGMQRRQGILTFVQQIPYPFMPIVNRFSRDNLMVNRLSNVVFQFVSSVDTAQVVPEGVVREPLIFSSARSSTQEGFFFIQPMPQQQQPELSGGPYILGAAYTGTFPSAYTPGRASNPTRLVVVGDGDFINETVMQGVVPGNIELGLNIVDWLVQDDALLAIRAKAVEPRQLQEVSEGVRPFVKYANMLGPVLLVVLIGLFRWRQRKSRPMVMAG